MSNSLGSAMVHTGFALFGNMSKFLIWLSINQKRRTKTLFFGAPKSLQMVIAAMKLKDAYSLEGKL